MRHHGRAEDADGEQHAVGAGEARDQAAGDARRRRRRPAAGRRGSRAARCPSRRGDRQLEARGSRASAAPRMPNATTAVIRPAVNGGTPKSRLSAIAAPTNSARSVAIAIDLGLHPQAPGDRAREVLAAQLGQVLARWRRRSWPTGTAPASPSGSRRRSPRPAGSRTWRRRRCWWRSCPGRCRRPRRRTRGRAARGAPACGARERGRRARQPEAVALLTRPAVGSQDELWHAKIIFQPPAEPARLPPAPGPAAGGATSTRAWARRRGRRTRTSWARKYEPITNTIAATCAPIVSHGRVDAEPQAGPVGQVDVDRRDRQPAGALHRARPSGRPSPRARSRSARR